MSPSAFVELDWAGRRVRIEHVWLRRRRRERPLLIFLHEGLGSVSMWRDFPARLCEQLDLRGLVYSRPGYGRSTPRAAGETWQPDFMHRQALQLLPALRAALAAQAPGDFAGAPPWLLGHSDGGSIALLYAAHHPAALAGAVLLAPHIRVEDISVTSIARARQAYDEGDLRARLARHHADPDSAFRGWNDAWLAPAFRAWSIAHEIAPITCPLLAIQGLDDEYGTPAQVQDIALRVPQTQVLLLAHCGHAPHRDQPQAVIEAVRGCLQAAGVPMAQGTAG